MSDSAQNADLISGPCSAATHDQADCRTGHVRPFQFLSVRSTTVFDADGLNHAHCVHGPFRRRRCRKRPGPDGSVQAAFTIVKRWINRRPIVPPATVPKVFTRAGLENAMQLHRLLWMDRLVGSMREFAPYAALELAFPGGSLIALALWAARHH